MSTKPWWTPLPRETEYERLARKCPVCGEMMQIATHSTSGESIWRCRFFGSNGGCTGWEYANSYEIRRCSELRYH